MTMPSPRRLARQSVTLLMGLGMTKPDAARLVVIVCDEVAAIIWRRDPELDVTWLAQIAYEAGVIRRQARPVPPVSELEAAYDAAYPVVSRLIRQLADRRRQAPPADATAAVQDYSQRVDSWAAEFDKRPGA